MLISAALRQLDRLPGYLGIFRQCDPDCVYSPTETGFAVTIKGGALLRGALPRLNCCHGTGSLSR